MSSTRTVAEAVGSSTGLHVTKGCGKFAEEMDIEQHSVADVINKNAIPMARRHLKLKKEMAEEMKRELIELEEQAHDWGMDLSWSLDTGVDG